MFAELVTRGARQLLSGLQIPDRWLGDWASQGEETSSGEYINEENALNCPAVKACVSALSEGLIISHMEICRQSKSGKVEPCTDHDAQDLFTRAPNEETNDVTFRDTMQNNLGTYGNGFAVVQRRLNGKPFALWNRSPKPERTKPFRSTVDGKIYYECRDNKGRLDANIPAADMVHIKYFSMDALMGKSPVRMIRESIGGNRAAERFANEVFKNGDAAHGYFTHPGKLGEAAYNRLKKSLGEQSEHGARHRKQVLEEGMQFASTSYNMSDMQLIEARKHLDLVVAIAYRIDPRVLYMLMSGTTVAELGRNFVIFTLLPWCARWSSEINLKVLTAPYFVRFNFSSLMRNDPNALASQHRTHFAIGNLSINEMRHELGMNPLDDPNADEHFVPLNMVPLSKAGEMSAKGSPTGGDPDKPMPGAPTGGDGITPAMPNADEGGRPPKEPGSSSEEQNNKNISPEMASPTHVVSQLAVMEAEQAVVDKLAYLSGIERNAAERAAKDPRNFLAKLETFYGKHRERMRDALESPIRTLLILRDGPTAPTGLMTECELDATIDRHIEAHRSSLLTAAECSPADLPDCVAAVTEDWGST